MGTHIIVVEDTPDSLQLMSYLLRAHDHTVTPFNNAEGGVALAAQDPPGLIVMDLQLADGIDGFEAVRQLRAAPATREVPVVAVTAFAMVGDREQALAAGFSDYLTKPIDPYTFAQDIDRNLPPALRGRRRPPPEQESSEATDEAEPTPQENGCVLAVDDQPANIDLLRSVLVPNGYRVAGAVSIDEAVVTAQTIQPDLVLSDVHIRNESGLDLWRRFQNDPALAAIPFAFTTATAGLLDNLPGPAEVIRRPIEPNQLLTRVRCLVRAQPSDDHHGEAMR